MYTPPSVRDVVDQLTHAKIFSKSDACSGFHQLGLAEEDRIKTTFTCLLPEGPKKFMFKVACLGLAGLGVLTTALECQKCVYQQMMEDAIAGINEDESKKLPHLQNKVYAYLDDIIFASPTIEEHAEFVKKVFKRLSEHKIYLHPEKCLWGVKELDFLGLKISHNHVEISEEKIQALRDFPIPTSVLELRRFIGFATYLSAFIPH